MTQATALQNPGRASEAEEAYRRSVKIYDALWKANPDNLEIKAGYAASLCSLALWEKAEQLVDEVLALMPRHPYANQLKFYITSRRGS